MCSIGVAQRAAALHLRNVLRRVKLVPLCKIPAKASRQTPSDRRLADTGDAHHDGNSWTITTLQHVPSTSLLALHEASLLFGAMS
jgi:hypothetical protein